MEGVRKGDQRLIAEATGLSVETVKKTIRGERKNAKVLAAIERLIANRNTFIQETKQLK